MIQQIFVLLITCSIIKSEQQIVVQVSLEEQISYIKKLAKYQFEQSRWRKLFMDSYCPGYCEVLPVEGLICKNLFPNPIEPLKPSTLCEFNNLIEDCYQDNNKDKINPDCEKFPHLCQPPTFCDIPGNEFSENCLQKNCEKNPESQECIFASKCMFDNYKDSDQCQKQNPCLEDPSICLTECDKAENKYKVRCIIEQCDRFPDRLECVKVQDCKVVPDCYGIKEFLDPRCCPQKLCDPECLEDKIDCDNVNPPDRCTWGYKLGGEIIKLMIEPIQKQFIDDTGITKFVKCYSQYLEKEKIELKCFEKALADNYVLLTEALKKSLIEKALSYDNVDVEVSENGIDLDLTSKKSFEYNQI